jgi:hypothetical protein
MNVPLPVGGGPLRFFVITVFLFKKRAEWKPCRFAPGSNSNQSSSNHG